MEYALLIVGDDDAYQALDEATAKEMYAGHFEFMDALKAAGRRRGPWPRTAPSPTGRSPRRRSSSAGST